MNRGFSLVELSIVLVILGLLTGGILAGQSLIRASELRSVTTEYQRYTTATQSFRDKYFGLPGDITNATKFWTTAPSCPAAGTGTQTCDGNGDGVVQSTGTSHEYFRYWQQLANAGLIEGTYTGVTSGANDYSAVLGTNVPRSKLGNAGWSLYRHSTVTPASAAIFEGTYGTNFSFGAQTINSHTFGPVLKPEECWNLDTKLDDGKPGTGMVTVREDYTNCHDMTPGATPASSANYRLNNTGADCSLMFLRAAGDS